AQNGDLSQTSRRRGMSRLFAVAAARLPASSRAAHGQTRRARRSRSSRRTGWRLSMGRARGDIDPMADGLGPQERRRKHRTKPDPEPDLKARKAKLRDRAVKRPHTPAILFEQVGEGEFSPTSPHNDRDLWELQIA